MGSLKSAFSQGLYEISSTQKEALGTLRIEQDGRKFRYVKAGTGGTAAGKMTIGAAVAANHINVAVPYASAIGDKIISVTVGATAVTADQYAEGYLQVNDATGEGYQYKIASNTACDASGTTVVTLEEGIRVALVASTSEVSLVPNPYNGVTVSDVEESMATGVSCGAITATYYGWVQTGGIGICLAIGTPAVGTNLTLASTAGGVTGISTTIATTVTQPVIGYVYGTAFVTTEYKPVFLKID